jgi:hypothetical protein
LESTGANCSLVDQPMTVSKSLICGCYAILLHCFQKAADWSCCMQVTLPAPSPDCPSINLLQASPTAVTH